ncbi:hypothetical protein EGI32_18930 [Ferruginibacter sp. HRS2-29]|nr:hypothetical protein [Ferruginibacter sp. HRS2-29]
MGVNADTGLNFNPGQKQFLATARLIDAAINSINSLNSLIKKESYRNKVTAFNNPASSELGFSLQAEIQNALKPLLDKAKNTNTGKFSGVVSSIINTQFKNQPIAGMFATTGIFSSLISLVGNLALHEKRISRQDLDSFVVTLNKYFIQYEKLSTANKSFDADINKLNARLTELQFDTKEYLMDMITVLYKVNSRESLSQKGLEELLLKYMDKETLEDSIHKRSATKYPGDGIKTAKEIVYGIQKLFNEYQQVYSGNFNEIKTILQQNKDLGKNIDVKQIEITISVLQNLYEESRNADMLNLRLTTLAERLKALTITEQIE